MYHSKRINRGTMSCFLGLSLLLGGCGGGANFQGSTAADAPADPKSADGSPLPQDKIADTCQKKVAVVLTLDVSKSMNEADGTPEPPLLQGSVDQEGKTASPQAGGKKKIEIAITAAQDFIGKFSKTQDDLMGIVAFSTHAVITQPLTQDRSGAQHSLAALRVDQSTNMYEGLVKTAEVFHALPDDSDYVKVAILMSDGMNNHLGNPVEQARRLKANGIILLTMGYAQSEGKDTMQQIASDPAYYFDSADGAALTDNFQKIATALCRQ
jgi:uncharacterized protein YegL